MTYPGRAAGAGDTYVTSMTAVLSTILAPSAAAPSSESQCRGDDSRVDASKALPVDPCSCYQGRPIDDSCVIPAFRPGLPACPA